MSTESPATPSPPAGGSPENPAAGKAESSGDGAARTATRGSALLAFLAGLLAVSVFFLILAGGQVTSTDSGDSVANVITSGGVPKEGRAWFELSHREVGWIVGGLAVAFLLLCFTRYREFSRSTGVARIALWAVPLIAVQGVLGMARVKIGNALGAESLWVTAVAVTHALLGPTAFCLVVTQAVLAARPAAASGRPPSSGIDPKLRRSATFALHSVYLQLFLGAILRLTRPGPNSTLVLIHILGAVLVAYALLSAFGRVQRNRDRAPELVLPGVLGLVLLVVQIALGFLAFFAVRSVGSSLAEPELSWQTVIPTMHVGVGSLLLADAFWMLFRTRRLLGGSLPRGRARHERRERRVSPPRSLSEEARRTGDRARRPLARSDDDSTRTGEYRGV